MTSMSLTGLNLPFGRALTVDDFDRIPWAGAKFELLDGVLVVSDSNITVDDLDDVPDDGHRYELLDGVLVVSPAPSVRHQRIVARLHLLLHEATSRTYEVFMAPLDVKLPNTRTRMQPDLVVVRDVDIAAQTIPVPLLAVEVLSPRTRVYDQVLKKELLAEAGCPHFWIVDPDEPSVQAWRLVDGTYVDAGRAEGSATLTLDQPFDVTVVPQSLLER